VTIVNHGTTPSHTPDERDAIIEAGWQLDGAKPEEPEPADEPVAEGLTEKDFIDLAETTLGLVKSNADQRNAQTAAAEAWQSYEDGEYDPADLADHLLATEGEAAAAMFARRWAQEEGALDDPEYAHESEAVQWIYARDAQRTANEQFAASIEAAKEYASQLAAQEKVSQELAASNREFFSRQDVAALAPTVKHFMANAQPVASKADLVTLQEAAFRAAKEAVRANQVAGVLTEFDEDIARERAFLPGRPEDRDDFDPAEAFSQNLAASVDPRRVMPGPTKADVEAQLDEELFGKERILEAAWNLNGDTGSAKLREYAHRKGLPIDDPHVIQVARKRNWL